MIRFLVDTNTVSELFRPRPSPSVASRTVSSRGSLAIASTSWHELSFGCERLPPSKRRDDLSAFLVEVVLPGFAILPYDSAAAEWHAKTRASREARGLTSSFPDGQIAAVAATSGLVLVTRNVRDFEGFADLRIENWFET